MYIYSSQQDPLSLWRGFRHTITPLAARFMDKVSCSLGWWTTWLQQSARSVYLEISRVIDSYLSLQNYTDSFNSLPPSFGLLALKVPTSEPPEIRLLYKSNLARKLIHCTNKSICTCKVCFLFLHFLKVLVSENTAESAHFKNASIHSGFSYVLV